jgi:hypothetical protein
LGLKNAFATFIGVFQSLVGISAIIVANLIYYNPDFFALRTILNLQQEHVTFYMMILFIIGLFAIISGLLVIYEWSSRS